MATKPEHHEAVRSFVKSLKPPLKLSLAALETLAVIAYKQPITAPEIMDIRGVQGAGVLKTLLDRKLIVAAGRKQVIGKPVLYKTTRDFLVQFGLKDLAELPTLKEFEEIRRMSIPETDTLPGLGEEKSEPTSDTPAIPAETEPAVPPVETLETQAIDESSASQETPATQDGETVRDHEMPQTPDQPVPDEQEK
jgi:segregation and condensation protein B